MGKYDREFYFKNYRFKMTSFACPEQYDVFRGDKQVAYLRLRWGVLCMHVPDSSGVCIPLKIFDDEWKGEFDSEEERFEAFTIVVSILDRIFPKEYFKEEDEEEEEGDEWGVERWREAWGLDEDE